MKIDLQSIDREQFLVHEHIVNGEIMFLVQPQQKGCKWTKENKIFRSSLWNSEGELVSAGFPKFVNWGESPEVFPVPTSLEDCTITEKMDGSLLIVAKYKGNYILRTRGTVDATKMEKNGHEIEIFNQQILSKLNNDDETWEYSILFEWTSPINKIVLNYGDEPSWILVGFIDHRNYSLAQQENLDVLARKYNLTRPTTYVFGSLEQMLPCIKQWKGKEGIVIYSNNGQSLHKVKSAWYLYLHRMKSELSSLEKVIDVWLEFDQPGYQEFYEKIAKQFDYELAETCRGFISQICDAWKEVYNILDSMSKFLTNNVLPIGDTKDKKIRAKQAQVILASYCTTGRSAMLFKLLDNKPLDNDDYKKLIFQVLK